MSLARPTLFNRSPALPAAQPGSFKSRSNLSLVFLLILLGTHSLHARAQMFEGSQPSNASAFVTIGGENTQLPHYADNALGFDLGVALQSHPFLGAEFRFGAYPFSARYVQMPITGGYRVAAHSLFGFPYAPFAYVGAGVSRSQDESLSHLSLPSHFVPCWQAEIGLDRTFHSFTWRTAQISWRETYASQNTLRSVGVSTGIVYHFQR
jgi:hypothetical protein